MPPVTYESLLEKGYFAKELPPPFQTKILAGKIKDIDLDWININNSMKSAPKPSRDTFKEKFRESKWVSYSIPKVGFSRRLLGIPNPYHQTILSKTISNNWSSIQNIYKKSKISNSKPIIDSLGGRSLKTEKTFSEFKRQCLINSFDRLFEVIIDISRYYDTIYTHAIPWIIHTKPIAKANRTDLNLLGNLLDKNLRESNSGQTLGIPIGPDTSLAISEIIGCKFDEMFQAKFKPSLVKGFRFIDDYHIYCPTQSDSDNVVKYLQSLFVEYQLDINEEKTKIHKSPYSFESDWSIELGSFRFRYDPKAQHIDLERFASISFKWARNNSKDAVLNFAISILNNVHIFKECWNVYQSLILKIALTEPATLPTVAQILVDNKTKVDIQKIKSVVENIINEHISKAHHFEVAWALWICKEFKIKLSNKLAKQIFQSDDVISILIALDLRNNGYIDAKVSIKHIEAELTTESLMDNKWLLTYEAIEKKWLTPANKNIIVDNEYFNILSKHKIEFYNNTNSLVPNVNASRKQVGINLGY